MKKLLFAICIVACTFPQRSVRAQDRYEYVIALSPDTYAYFPSSDSIRTASRPTIDLVAGPESAEVRLSSNLNVNYLKTINISPYEHITYEVWRDLRLTGDTSQEVASDHVLMISSSAPLNCYMIGIRSYQGTEEGILVPEKRACGKDYRLLNYYSDTLMKDEVIGHSFVGNAIIVSFESDTKVSITPSSSTATGRTSEAPLMLTLDKGQCVRVYGAQELWNDPTGMIIAASKSIAVYSRHSGTQIPSYLFGLSLAYRVAFRETLTPLEFWGHNYYVTIDSANRRGYIARALASENNTVVYLNGESWGSPLNANEFRDTLLQSNAFISFSRRGLIGQLTVAPGGVDTFSSYLTIVPPLEQLSNDLTFVSFEDTIHDFSSHFVAIVTARSGKGRIRIDGNIVEASRFFDVPYTANEVDLSAAVIPVSPGAHRITSENHPSSGFVLLASGHSSHGINQTHSYGYGIAGYHQPIKASVSLPATGQRSLLNIYPNPSNGSITIDYESKLSGAVTLLVYSVNGVLVHEEIVALASAGKPVQLDASGWASGAYTIVLKSGDEEAKASLIKN